ncbi:MAG: hypothetical protein ABJB86_16585 [Bacteroidota bacterium]
MRQLLCLLFFATIFTGSKAQLVAKSTCGVFTVDILDGKLNGLKPDARWQEVKDALPCFTASQPDGDTTKCGGGIFFKDKDVYFFTDRDYIEIREKFQGKLSIPVMGASRTSLFSILGNPKVKDDTWEAFQMAYGCLVLHYNKLNKVNLIQFSSRGTETLSLCSQSPN